MYAGVPSTCPVMLMRFWARPSPARARGRNRGSSAPRLPLDDGEEHVLRLHVAVDHAGGVRRVEAGGTPRSRTGQGSPPAARPAGAEVVRAGCHGAAPSAMNSRPSPVSSPASITPTTFRVRELPDDAGLPHEAREELARRGWRGPRLSATDAARRLFVGLPDAAHAALADGPDRGGSDRLRRLHLARGAVMLGASVPVNLTPATQRNRNWGGQGEKVVL